MVRSPRAVDSTPALLRLVARAGAGLRAPGWVKVAAALLVLYPLAVLVQGTPDAFGRTVDIAASTVRLVFEGAAFLWAAGRRELPTRLRLALQITGWASFASAVNYLLLMPPLAGGPELLSPNVDAALTLMVYLAGFAALIVYPRTPARLGERAPLVIDVMITAGGLGLLSWLLVTQPSVARVVDPAQQRVVFAFGLAQLAILVGVNLVIMRGQMVPSRRAFWWFATGQATYIPVVLFAQLERAAAVDPRWSTVFYFAGVIPSLAAAVAMRGDPLGGVAQSRGPAWLRDFNPLPLVAPVAVGASLILLLSLETYDYALPLAATLVAVSLLLAVRLLLSAHHSARLAREEAAKERRRQAEKLQAVGRLAGGVAHEFNNLMARVVGNAELGEASLPPGVPERENFHRVKVAAMRAAELTRQLLAFSGQQRTLLTPIDAEPTVRAVLQEAIHALPGGIVTDLQVGPGPFAVHADESQLAAALEQIVENAVEAMPGGGRLEVGLRREYLHDPLSTPFISVPPGEYVAISVRDTGVGIPPASLESVCDPFYSTKSRHLAAGLGLASVHGIVVSHSGGMRIDSTLGVGTTVTLYLPSR